MSKYLLIAFMSCNSLFCANFQTPVSYEYKELDTSAYHEHTYNDGCKVITGSYGEFKDQQFIVFNDKTQSDVKMEPSLILGDLKVYKYDNSYVLCDGKAQTTYVNTK